MLLAVGHVTAIIKARPVIAQVSCAVRLKTSLERTATKKNNNKKEQPQFLFATSAALNVAAVVYVVWVYPESLSREHRFRLKKTDMVNPLGPLKMLFTNKLIPEG